MTSIRLRPVLLSLALTFFFSPVSAQTTDNYEPGPDSKLQAGVPRGEILKFTFDKSNSSPAPRAIIGSTTEFIADSKRGNGNAFGPDGRLYAVAMGETKVFAYDADGKPATIVEGWVGNDITVAHNGNVYVTNPPADNENAPSKVWPIRPNGEKIDTGLEIREWRDALS
jgi:hypothetical protein